MLLLITYSQLHDTKQTILFAKGIENKLKLKIGLKLFGKGYGGLEIYRPDRLLKIATHRLSLTELSSIRNFNRN